MNQAAEKFDLWCLVELFGHSKIAGRCTEQNIAGTNMLRVDVPETSTQPSFTRFFGSAAIYAINPLDEETCKFMAEKIQVKPIETWNVSEVMKKHQNSLMLSQGVSLKQSEADAQEREVPDIPFERKEEDDEDYPELDW